VYECSLRDPNWHLDGLAEGDAVYLDIRSSILLTLVHELIHRRKPRLGEQSVERLSRRLFCKMTETEKRRWWRAYRKIRKPRRPKEVDG
jgi:hypothetical protein